MALSVLEEAFFSADGEDDEADGSIFEGDKVDRHQSLPSNTQAELSEMPHPTGNEFLVSVLCKAPG